MWPTAATARRSTTVGQNMSTQRPRAGAIWSTLLVLLSIATLVNLYTYSYRSQEHQDRDNVQNKAWTGTPLHRNWGNTEKSGGSARADAGAVADAAGPTKTMTSTTTPQRNRTPRAKQHYSNTLPLGRDRPFQLMRHPDKNNNSINNNNKNTNKVEKLGQQVTVRGDDDMVVLYSEATREALSDFPCSMTQEDELFSAVLAEGGNTDPAVGNAGAGGGGRFGIRAGRPAAIGKMKAAAAKSKSNGSKAWSSSGQCVIACLEEGGGGGRERRRLTMVPGDDIGDRLPDGHNIGAEAEAETTSGALNHGRENVTRYYGCERALRACELYQECTHILLPASPLQFPHAEGGGEVYGQDAQDAQEQTTRDRSGVNINSNQNSPPVSASNTRFATLLHLPQKDNSMMAVEAAAAAKLAGGGSQGGWGGGAGFTLRERPRTYYVVSFGGSGSKMLGGWLSERGKGMVKQVFHFHDPNPPDKLFVKEAAQNVRPGAGRGKDFRGYAFPEGAFPSSGQEVGDVDSYRVVLIFKDPAEALISRYFYNHCKNIKGADCGKNEASFPGIESYANEEGNDRLNMEAFYDNYCGGEGNKDRRNYPVVCVNYHKMWDNKLALVRALGLPPNEASKLPTRTETVRNVRTSAKRGEPYTLALREQLRRKHASLSRKVFEAPAVAIV